MALDETPGTITDPQSKFITDLVVKKDLSGNDKYTPTPEQRAWLEAGNYSSMSKAQASKAIGLLLSLNDKPVEPSVQDLVDHDAVRLPVGATSDEWTPENDEGMREEAERTLERDPVGDPPTPVQALENKAREFHKTELDDEIKAGYYFIVDPTDNVEKFFHVSKGKEGTRWEGRTFLEVRASDTVYPVKLAVHREAVYREILKDPVTAMNEYGIRLGMCGCCGRTLTARDSRLRGIGPICAARIMMEESQATQEQLELLQRLGIRKG